MPRIHRRATGHQKTPYGWSAGIYGGGMDNVKYGLSNIQFSSGDPSEYAWLVPDTDKKHSATWQFVPKSKEGYWITCEYQLTSVTLTQRLPDDVKSCTVEYDARFSNPVPKSVRCKR